MYAPMPGLMKSAEQPFNIIEEYAALSPKRKALLCDHYFVEGRNKYESTVKLFWPAASEKDMRKLGIFLILLKNAAH